MFDRNRSHTLDFEELYHLLEHVHSVCKAAGHQEVPDTRERVLHILAGQPEKQLNLTEFVQLDMSGQLVHMHLLFRLLPDFQLQHINPESVHASPSDELVQLAGYDVKERELVYSHFFRHCCPETQTLDQSGFAGCMRSMRVVVVGLTRMQLFKGFDKKARSKLEVMICEYTYYIAEVTV